ncbi:MAG: hypothetical protein AAB692_05455, partial [Patescibacteria group bacterium]
GGLALASGGTAARAGLAAARGFFGSMGLYMTMRNVADRNLTKLAADNGEPEPAGKLRKMFRFLGKGIDWATRVKSAEDIKKMSLEEVNALYAQIHERAAAEMDLKAVTEENPLLRTVEARRSELVAEDTEKSLKMQLAEVDEQRAAMGRKRERGDMAMKALAVAGGIWIGSRTFDGVNEAAAKSVGAAASELPDDEASHAMKWTKRIIEPALAEKTPFSPEQLKNGLMQRGDGFSQMWDRQLESDPKNCLDINAVGRMLGVDPEKLQFRDGMDPHAWAEGISKRLIKFHGISDKLGEVRADWNDSKLPAYSMLRPDSTFINENIKTYGFKFPELPAGKVPSLDLEKGFSFGDGMTGKFARDVAGNLSFEGGKVTAAGMEHAKEILLNNEGWARLDTMSEDLRQEALRSLDLIDRDEAALKALMKAGKGSSEEAEMLRTMVRSTVKSLKDQYGEIFSSESGQRLAIMEASARDMSIREISLGSGLKGEFVYNASGRPMGFVSDMKTGREAIKTLFEKDSWSDLDTWKDRRLLVTRLFEDQKGFDALVKAGKAGSVEAKFLKSEIEVLAEDLKRTGAVYSENGLKTLKAVGDETKERLMRQSK